MQYAQTIQPATTYIETYCSDNRVELFEILNKWKTEGKSIVRESVNYICAQDELKSFMIETFWHCATVQLLETNTGEWFVRSDRIIIHTNSRSGAVHVEINGVDLDMVRSSVKLFDGRFKRTGSFIRWLYSDQGHSVEIPLSIDRLPIEEMYPFLKGESLESYYDRFIQNTASILLLIGPPGTGKTTFIRGLINHSQSNALVCYDTNILERDFVFSYFVDDDNLKLMVLEDSDNFLRPRTDDNTMMHRFLNVGDGLVTLTGKKMIFSTNLPSVSDIDPALTRPGRCFDVLTFDSLTGDQARTVANKLGTDLPDKNGNEFSIAEIFHEKTKGMEEAKKNKIGFIQ